MSFLAELLGEELHSHNGTVATETICGPDRVVALYFSAHWCPPCRRFTPELVEWYNKLKEKTKESFEIIFVSSDKDESTFNEYYQEMPWLAMPFSSRDLKGRVSGRYKVEGIPTLIFIDSVSVEVHTKDGRSIVASDPEGTGFPFKPQPLEELLTGKLLSPSGEVDASSVLAGKIMGLYFSAHWCPPCKAFTPKLIETYKKLKEKANFEIVFVSSDRSDDQFNEYYHGNNTSEHNNEKGMPWLSYPRGDSRGKALSSRFEIRGIPALIVLDENNEVITKAGREAVMTDPDGEAFPWYPKAVMELTENGIDLINEEACLLYFTGGDPSHIEKALGLEELIRENWTLCQINSSLHKLSIMYEGTNEENEEIATSVRQFLQLPSDISPLVVIVDCPNAGKYILKEELCSSHLETLVTKFTNGELDLEPLR